jgi:hypothetical protein
MVSAIAATIPGVIVAATLLLTQAGTVDDVTAMQAWVKPSPFTLTDPVGRPLSVNAVLAPAVTEKNCTEVVMPVTVTRMQARLLGACTSANEIEPSPSPFALGFTPLRASSPVQPSSVGAATQAQSNDDDNNDDQTRDTFMRASFRR